MEIELKLTDREKQQHCLNLDTDWGFNLMEILKASEFPVEGTCGGMALCASCHIYIKSYEHELPPQSEQELLILDQVFDVTSESRLACQIPLSILQGNLEIELAPQQ
ncbi:MAG TPA: 2Fe-2S iron-sulfur cluster-binding protein [Saprospiraceae bacterium]|nr:2Fe-2S iron-sulfur cluster-binding protein [Saprospiraceae bacterium]